MRKLTRQIFPMCGLMVCVMSLLSAPTVFAHKGAMGIVKERMDRFEASEKVTKRIKQALSHGDTALVMAEAEFLVSWAREMENYFPENSNQSPSEAKDEIWLRWSDFIDAIQSFEDSAQDLINAASSGEDRVARVAYKNMTASCKSCHRQFRKE